MAHFTKRVFEPEPGAATDDATALDAEPRAILGRTFLIVWHCSDTDSPFRVTFRLEAKKLDLGKQPTSFSKFIHSYHSLSQKYRYVCVIGTSSVFQSTPTDLVGNYLIC